MDEDWIEEDILVYVDFGKFVASSEITDPDLQFKIIDLERPKVFSEVNGKVFSGELPLFDPYRMINILCCPF